MGGRGGGGIEVSFCRKLQHINLTSVALVLIFGKIKVFISFGCQNKGVYFCLLVFKRKIKAFIFVY